jgi:hypothetical protein
MSRVLKTPKDPEAVGLAVIALRHFAKPVQNPTEFETEISDSLKKLKVSRKTAERLLKNFDSIRPSVRTRYLGKTYDAKTRPPKRIARRDSNVITAAHVVIPQFSPRNPFDPPAKPLPEQVPAPNDYLITYEGLYCIDETGWDKWGSDESYVVTSAVHITQAGDNVVRTERHPFSGNKQDHYNDVDSEEVRIGPRAACWKGDVADVRAGMSLTTTVFDHDMGDEDAYRDEIDALVKLAIAGAAALYDVPNEAIPALMRASVLITDFVNWLAGTGDDEVGTRVLVLELGDLENYARSRTADYTRPGHKATGLKYHFLGTVNDNDYAVAYQVRRNPPAPLFPQGPIE